MTFYDQPFDKKEFSHPEFERLIEVVIAEYTNKESADKLRKIDNKLQRSATVKKFIAELQKSGIPPTAKQLHLCIDDIFYFLFMKKETRKVAAILVLRKWNKEVNSIQHILKEKQLHALLQQLLSHYNK